MSTSGKKRILVVSRVRRVPRQGWSWIDRRFLREHAPSLSHDAIALYFFFAAVADKHGVSFYGDGTIAGLLKLGSARVAAGREELVVRDLVAYESPSIQVLSLPEQPRRGPSSPVTIGDLLRRLARGES